MGIESLPDWETLSEEKKEALKKLEKSAAKNGLVMGLKFCGLFVLSNLALISLNAAFLDNSLGFGFVGGAINGFFLGRYLMSGIKAERDRIQAEVKKIFSN